MIAGSGGRRSSRRRVPAATASASGVAKWSATSLLQPSVDGPIGEHPVIFLLGIALTLGLLLTGIATFHAEVIPRSAALLLLGAMAGFLSTFFVAEFLPPAAGQLGTAVFGVLLGLGFAWIGVRLWLRNPAA